MSIEILISLIMGVLTLVSSLSAAITCVLHYRFSKPKIQIGVNSLVPQENFYIFQTKPTGEALRFAYLKVVITNTSAVAGTVASFSIIHKKGKYPVETIGSNYKPDWFKITFPEPLNQDEKFFRLKLPLVVPPYSVIMGYFIFPDFPPISENEIEVIAECTIVNNKVKVKKTKPFKMYNGETYAMGKLHYTTGVYNYDLYEVFKKYKIVETQTVTYSYVQNRFDLPK